MKRRVLSKLSKRGEVSYFLQFIKGFAFFAFVIGMVAIASRGDTGTILPIHAATEDEIIIEKNFNGEVLNDLDVYLDARLLASVNAPTPEETGKIAVGGAIDQVFSTSQGSAFIAKNLPLIPDIPSGEREEITTYVVKPGDTPSGIAASFALRLSTLLWANDLSSASYIRPGDELTILPVDGLFYEVRPGDTLSSIASAYKSDVDKILRVNDIESVEHIIAGQTLILPDAVKPVYVASRTPSKSYTYTQNLSGYFITPTKGRISQRLHGKNAVDIAGGCWQPVEAAASGNVGISVGNGRWNGGYGSYTTINHPNGTRTLYAHLVSVSVYSGQWVLQGQVIGYTGSTGRSSGCHLHWEVHGARNPLAY